MSQQTRPIEYRRCARCGHHVRPERMVKGFGRDCATFLGLIGDTVDTGHDGPDLLDLLAAVMAGRHDM